MKLLSAYGDKKYFTIVLPVLRAPQRSGCASRLVFVWHDDSRISYAFLYALMDVATGAPDQMRQMNFDLASLVAPYEPGAFFSDFWEQRHLFVKREQPRYYESLITAADLENIISSSDARYPAIRLAKGGNYYAPEAYTRNVKHGDENFMGVPDINKIFEEYRRGATVALPAIHRTWKAIGSLCDHLQSTLDHAAHANVYITPGNAKGFTPHYDVHEVFVLQIAGSKCWQLYEPVITLPHRTQLFRPEFFTGQAPMTEIELNAGDMLYLPRGILHSTTTAESYSAHLTIGVTVYTWADLIKEMLSSAIDDEDTRRALPPGFASRSEFRSVLRERMLASLDTLPAKMNTDRLIDSFIARVRGAHPNRAAAFRADVTVIDPTSAFQTPTEDRYTLLEDQDRRLLDFNGTRYQLTEPVARTLGAMCRLGRFKPEDLPEHLDIASRLDLVRHLLDIQFLTACKSAKFDGN